MKVSLSLFPVLDQSFLRKIGYMPSPLEFYYEQNGIIYPLEVTDLGDGTNLSLNDARGVWNPEEYGFQLKAVCTIRHPNVLYGPNGIAPVESSIGLSLMWLSRSSSVRGVATFDQFIKNSESIITLSCTQSFPPGTFRESIIFSFELYLAALKEVAEDEVHLARKQGTLFGCLDSYKLILDGSGSMFPILETADPSAPLWWVECLWDDPLVDNFDGDAVAIHLNTAHPSYKAITDDSLADSPLLKEIIASALQVIIQHAMEDSSWESIRTGTNIEEGSVGAVLSYFINTLEWQFDSPSILALSIRDYLDKRM